MTTSPATVRRRTIKFTVKRSEADGRFYVHMTHGNPNIIFAQPRGRASASAAFGLCSSTWNAVCDSVDPMRRLPRPPTPYTADSLKPRATS